MLAHGRWFSPGTAASSTTKTGRHDVAETFAESGIKHKKSINQNQPKCYSSLSGHVKYCQYLLSVIQTLDLQTLIFNQLFYSLLLQPCNVEINHRFAALPFNLKLALDNLIPH